MFNLRNNQSPLSLLLITTASIFVAEAFVMYLFSTLQVVSIPFSVMLLDASLLTIFIVPVLYISFFRPMIMNIGKCHRTGEELRKAKGELEVKVSERTKELNRLNEGLRQEIEERRRAEEETFEAKIQLQHLLETSPVVIYSCRVEGERFMPTFASSNLKDLFGYELSDYIEKSTWWMENLHPEDRERIIGGFIIQLFENDNVDHEYRFKAKDGQYLWVHDKVRLIRDKEGQPKEVVGSWMDITERKKYENTIMKMAYYDSLTGLPNKSMFIDRCNQVIAAMKRRKLIAAILFLDIDRFKLVNDTLGHSSGDKLLQEIAARLNKFVRTSDTVARLGGDEFIVLLTDISRIEDVTKLVKRILKTFERPIQINEHEFTLNASIGISVFPEDGDDVETLLKKADIAMYSAKREKQNSYKFYTSSMSVISTEWLKLEQKLRKALEKKEFLLYYQPQVDINTGALIGVESLLRWQDPEDGIINPGRIIPLAEDTGLIIPIGEWIFLAACRQGRIWQDQNLDPVKISVNVSRIQLKQNNFVSTIAAILQETGVNPGLIQIEITESIIMDNADIIIKVLTELKDIGVSFAIDDFGIGYSSLGYLKHMPIDMLKIDQSFVREMTTDANDAAICSAIIRIANSLNMDVIAEGVETLQQVNMLRDLNCRKIQGYVVSRPVPAEDFEQFLSKDWLFNANQEPAGVQ